MQFNRYWLCKLKLSTDNFNYTIESANRRLHNYYQQQKSVTNDND